MAANHGHHDCGGHVLGSAVHQTLDEMEFERGLWSAALTGQTDDIENRIEKGDDVNATDKSGYTALHYAARSGHIQVCRLLLRHGANVNATTNTGHATPLQRAAYMGHQSVVQLLLQHKADPLAVDTDGMTALHKAVERGHEDTVKLLLTSSPALKDVQDVKGRIPADMTTNPHLKSLLR
ncbi:hypothetical protein BaRGS_00023908 [Batillaria attramentaria]|uniref:Ankyrin repeat domain-containing protein 39 n=1 Tax=Batillaria attramentaria TaxID=370345 RepID=A0ABD0KD09_9CAEN